MAQESESNENSAPQPAPNNEWVKFDKVSERAAAPDTRKVVTEPPKKDQ
jgi:hypothetical protein